MISNVTISWKLNLICSKLTITIPEFCYDYTLLLTLNRSHILLSYFFVDFERVNTGWEECHLYNWFLQ